MPNRIIHEKACNSQTLDALSDSAERLFWRLMTKADDYGRFEADARILLGACFPLRIGRMKPERVEAMRDELARADAIMLYLVDGRIYGSFCAWDRHQRKRESKPKYPDPGLGTPFTPIAANGGEPPHVAARARTLGSRESRDVNERREPARMASGGEAPPPAADRAVASPGFQIPDEIRQALERAPRMRLITGYRRLRDDVGWWYAETRAHPALDMAACVLAAESWLVTFPAKAARKKNIVQFLHNWFKEEAARG